MKIFNNIKLFIGCETWLDIPRYKGLYQVSSHGRVRNIKFGKRKPLAQFKNRNKNPYLIVRLSKNNIKKVELVHRLVAEAFVHNPKSKKTVNHKDNNSMNNHFKNLEWCTQAENIRHYWSFVKKFNK